MSDGRVVVDSKFDDKDLKRGFNDLDKAMNESGKEAGNFASLIEDNWMQITAATAGLGLAVEGLARQQAPLTEKTRKLAASIDMAEDEMRDLARTTSNVTFPIEDVINVMEKGRQQGIKSAEQLQEFAQFWDMVGDATGENAVNLSEAGVALRAVGIAAGEEAQALAAFGYVSQETTSNVGEFLNFIERTGPELRELGLDINDGAAMLGLLEQEFGMSGRTARTEFRQAVNEADGDLNVMLETLGVSEEQFNQYRNAVADSSGVIERNSDIHAESYTLMQKGQQRISELTYQFGEQIGMLSDLSMVMIGIGPLLKGLISLKKVWTVVTGGATLAVKGLAAAKTFLLGPIGLVILAIAAIIAIGVLLWKNWDKVTEFAGKLGDNLKKIFENIRQVISDNVQKAIDTVKQTFTNILDYIKGLGPQFLAAGSGLIDQMVQGIKNAAGRAVQAVKDLAGSVRNMLPFSPAKEGPLSDLDKLDFGGPIEQSIKADMSEVQRAMSDLLILPQLNVSGNQTESNSAGSREGITQHITINSPEPMEPSDISRRFKSESRMLALEWGS